MPPKKFKTITYKPERNHHYLFIDNPWPHGQSLSDRGKQNTCCNSIVAWLCVMIEDLCGIEIHPTQVTVYYVSTQRYIIADIEIQPNHECPSPCLDPLLGAHHTSAFLSYGGESPNQISIIYYYDFVRFNSPAATNWTDITATFKSLHPQFPVKRAYPHPRPTDRPQIPKCLRLPGRLILGHPDCVPTPLVPPEPPAPQPSAPGPSNARGPSPPRQRTPIPPPPPPPHAEPELPMERQPTPRDASPPAPDPPPRSEFAFTPYQPPLHFRRPPGPARSVSRSTSSSESNSHSQPPPAKLKMNTKRDPYEEDEDALAHLRQDIKTEEEDPVRVKLEETSVKREPDTPSEELRANYAMVQARLAANSADPSVGEPAPASVSAHPPPTRVKEEPSVEADAALAHLRVKTEDQVPVRVKREESSVRVKREESSARVKLEPQSGFVKKEEEESTTLLNARAHTGVKREEVRVKMEPTTDRVRVKREDGEARGGVTVKSEAHESDLAQRMETYQLVQARLSAARAQTESTSESKEVKHEDGASRVSVSVKPEPRELRLNPYQRQQGNANAHVKRDHSGAREGQGVKQEDGDRARGVKLEWPDSGSMLVNEEEEDSKVHAKMEVDSEVKREPHSDSLPTRRKHGSSAADFFDTYASAGVKREPARGGVKLEWPDSGSTLVNEEEEEGSKMGLDLDRRDLIVKREQTHSGHQGSGLVPTKRQHGISAADVFDTHASTNASSSSHTESRSGHRDHERDRHNFNTREPYPAPHENRGNQRHRPPPPPSFPSRSVDPRQAGFVNRQDSSRREPSRTLSSPPGPVEPPRDQRPRERFCHPVGHPEVKISLRRNMFEVPLWMKQESEKRYREQEEHEREERERNAAKRIKRE